jgi:hypothetical protein
MGRAGGEGASPTERVGSGGGAPPIWSSTDLAAGSEGKRAGSGDGTDRGEREYGISGVFCAYAVHPYGTDGYHARDDGRDGDWFGNGSSFGRDGGVGLQYDHDQRYANAERYL